MLQYNEVISSKFCWVMICQQEPYKQPNYLIKCKDQMKPVWSSWDQKFSFMAPKKGFENVPAEAEGQIRGVETEYNKQWYQPTVALFIRRKEKSATLHWLVVTFWSDDSYSCLLTLNCTLSWLLIASLGTRQRLLVWYNVDSGIPRIRRCSLNLTLDNKNLSKIQYVNLP